MNIIPRRLLKKIGGIKVDAFISESHERRTSSTDYPIENGATISDHIRVEPDEIIIEGLMCPKGTSSVEYVYDQLSNLVEKKELVSVVTGLKVYINMQIQSLSVNREAGSGGSLPFSMSLKELKIVKSQTAAIPSASLAGSSSTQRQAQSPVDIGRTTGEI